MKTKITTLLGIESPVVQGGMAWVAESHLAAAVSNAGGLGIIGAASAPAERLLPLRSVWGGAEQMHWWQKAQKQAGISARIRPWCWYLR